jgi:hypothetical protein
MANIVRIPITNIYADGDFTGLFYVGAKKTSVNLLLDTGSSSLGLNGKKYAVDNAGGDRTTNLAQYQSYGDDDFTGAVITTSISVGEGASQVTLPGANVALSYYESADMWGKTDGILGLAYAAHDIAYDMGDDTTKNRHMPAQVQGTHPTPIVPFLTQLSGPPLGIVSDIVSFYTRRSRVHVGAGGAADPLNQGWMILGGGQEATDLYAGAFQAVRVVADELYNTNLKQIIVGHTAPIPVPPLATKNNPSNSIVDSGTNGLVFNPQLWNAVLSKFSAAQQAQLKASVVESRAVPVADLDLATWPAITFVLEGAAADVALSVAPSDYWQFNTDTVGAATAAIANDADQGFTMLGLPLMTGYFTVFDGEADGGRGVIRFATSNR